MSSSSSRSFLMMIRSSATVFHRASAGNFHRLFFLDLFPLAVVVLVVRIVLAMNAVFSPRGAWSAVFLLL